MKRKKLSPNNWSLLNLKPSCAHHLTVKRLKFRPCLGEAGVKATEVKDTENHLQLASCGSDWMVKVYTIHLCKLGTETGLWSRVVWTLIAAKTWHKCRLVHFQHIQHGIWVPYLKHWLHKNLPKVSCNIYIYIYIYTYLYIVSCLIFMYN